MWLRKYWRETGLVFILKLTPQVLLYVSISQNHMVSGTTKCLLSRFVKEPFFHICWGWCVEEITRELLLSDLGPTTLLDFSSPARNSRTLERSPKVHLTLEISDFSIPGPPNTTAWTLTTQNHTEVTLESAATLNEVRYGVQVVGASSASNTWPPSLEVDCTPPPMPCDTLCAELHFLVLTAVTMVIRLVRANEMWAK